MRYHDFHLSGYTVSDFGFTIELNLVYDYPNRPKYESHIEFSKVEAYHFVHTGGAIITDILEVSLTLLLDRVYHQLAEWSRQHGGYRHIEQGRPAYEAALEERGCRAWMIESAIGFEGFVIAANVEQKAFVELDGTT